MVLYVSALCAAQAGALAPLVLVVVAFILMGTLSAVYLVGFGKYRQNPAPDEPVGRHVDS